MRMRWTAAVGERVRFFNLLVSLSKSSAAREPELLKFVPGFRYSSPRPSRGCRRCCRRAAGRGTPRTGIGKAASSGRTSTGYLLERQSPDHWSKAAQSSLPRLPKLVMMSVKKVRKRGDAAAKYEILTVSSILLVRRTRKTKRGTTRKL